MEKVSLRAKLDRVRDHWSPRIVAEVNDTQVKLARVQGTFEWHHHELSDELFFVVSGRLLLQLPDREVWLEPGELFVVPRGLEHRPVASEETEIILVEARGTRNTGSVATERTVEEPKWI